VRDKNDFMYLMIVEIDIVGFLFFDFLKSEKISKYDMRRHYFAATTNARARFVFHKNFS
jgi:hypothetical protein